MSNYATRAESVDISSSPSVYSAITDDQSALSVYSEITDDPTATTAHANNGKAFYVYCCSMTNSSLQNFINSLAGLTLASLTKYFDAQNDYVSATSALVELTANNDQYVFVDAVNSADVSLVRYAVQLVLYKPLRADKKVAWSIISSPPTHSGTRNKIDLLAIINEGSAYNSTSNSVIIPVTGVYYLMLTVNGPFTSSSIHRVMLNTNTTALENSRRGSTVVFIGEHGYTDKSVMLSLAADDALTYLTSELGLDPLKPIAFTVRFSGFLLYPK